MIYDLRFIGYQKPDSIHNKAAARFGEVLRERLGQDVKFELIGDATSIGYKQFERPQLVISGEYPFWYQSTSYFTTSYVPDCGIIDLPYIFESQAHAFRALDGNLGKILSEKINRNSPFLLLGFWDNGIRHLSNSIRPIYSPSDCNGIRIRTLTSPLHGETFRALGMVPEVMDIATLLKRAAEGTIDAQDNPLTNIYNFGIHKLQPYITMTGHIWGAAALLVNRDIYSCWPARIQDAVQEATAIATAFQRELALAEDDRILSEFGDNVQVVRLTEDSRSQFEFAVQPVVEKHMTDFSMLLEHVEAAR